ncbi:MAG TPA: radical SAM protein [Myxococcota bacterium]|jgi:radical SAM protein with 4Fe4S-binding SPASM domain|nr:radical SAM protein [Myxococcota bacterium]MBP8971587.1 radical SAM protein [Myxococcota bacterium]HHW96315.1 radical SAM protein [Oligoflexales bacterium]HQC45601.1 radical SAM protein [Myxococcota bacterium]HQL57304.1 radical SAM protein [Myxococcota bacterium]
MALTSCSEFIPKWIAWETTQRCNLNCQHCRCASDLNAPFGEWTTERASKMIDEIADWVKPVLVLSGGEPLMRDDIFELAAHGTARGLRMCMATNGLLVTDDVCHQMKESGIRMVSLSLDGPDADVHDSFRRVSGAFDATLNAAKLFKKHDISFLFNSSFAKHNQHTIGDTFRLAKSLNATAWYMFMIVPTGRGADLMKDLISQPDYDAILEWHYEQEKRESEILMRPTCAPHYYRLVPQLGIRDGSRFKRRDLTFSTGAGKGCVAGQTICLLDALGNVRPCSYMEQSAGNVFERSFKDIWENSELMLSMRDFESYKGRCGVCEFRNVCGGCRARAYAITGDLFAEEPFCNYIPGSFKSPC